MNKQTALQTYAFAEEIRHSTSYERIKELFPTVASLIRFCDDVGQLSWPGSYGVSPWERAFSIAHYARGGSPVTNPFVLESEDWQIAMTYRREGGYSTERDEQFQLSTTPLSA